MRFPVIIALLLALSVSGCMESPADITTTSTTPPASLQTAAGSHGFMPLATGNHWSYDRDLSIVVIPDDGPPGPPEVLHERVDLEQTGTEMFGDTEYILERETYSSDQFFYEWLRRQDRAGYYLLEIARPGSKTVSRPTLSSARSALAARVASKHGFDTASVEALLERIETVRRALRGFDGASPSPPGGAMPYELTTLAYPLHPGATWTIRAEPLFTATVEARENYHGINAWRVRLDNEFLGENDLVHVWYSRCGQLGIRFHFESAATDEMGNPIGTLIGDDITEIVDAQVDRGGCGVITRELTDLDLAADRTAALRLRR